jgi:hypothetical protein
MSDRTVYHAAVVRAVGESLAPALLTTIDGRIAKWPEGEELTGLTMRRLHTADWRSRTATARLPGVLARTLPDAKAFATRVPGSHPNNFAEHR